ncbi:MAG: uL14 family ribosomal protein [Candidatus Moeniiplasma glomeromycotorum]|nr:uL14 family ribosomal protein [Candidatus Moeniiplasma glomeromycotorum]MCE8169367.1 uL14 family ribosomal protein [Candidatus Moeniiplasma glomeromycotorum]
MLQNETILEVMDNSGAQIIKVIGCLGGSNRRYSRIGDLVTASVIKANPESVYSKSKGKERAKIVKAVVVTMRGWFHRQNNTWIRFSKNCAVIIEKKEGKKWTPIAITRIFVPLLCEFDQWGYKKILSLAPEIL